MLDERNESAIQPLKCMDLVHLLSFQDRNALVFVAPPFALELLTFCCWFCWFSCLRRCNHLVVTGGLGDDFDELPFGVRQSAAMECMLISFAG